MITKIGNQHRVAIVYPFLAHYREPVFRLLSQQTEPNPEYTVFSDQISNVPTLKTVSSALAEVSPEQGGIRWYFVKNFFIGRMLLQTNMIRLALSREFDTIIYLGNMYFLTTWLGASIARLTGKRILMWTHGFLREDRGQVGWLRKRFYKVAHGLLLYGNRAAQTCQKLGFDPDHLYVIFNSLDYDTQVSIRLKINSDERKNLRAKLFKHQDWPVLVASCRLTERKMLYMVLDAAKALSRRGEDVNVLIIGDGPAKESLQKHAVDLGITDRLRLYGACHDEQILGPLISASTICVMPGEVGLTAMHALAYGTPVVTHDQADFQMPEYEAIIPGETGELFSRNSTEDLTDKIYRWLSRPHDREEIRTACYEVIDKLYNPYFQRRIINEAVNGTPASQCPAGRTAIEPLFPENIEQ